MMLRMRCAMRSRPWRAGRFATLRVTRPRSKPGRPLSPAGFISTLMPLPTPAATAATTTAAASPAIATAAATRTGALLARLVHLDIAAFEFGAVELGNRARRLIGIGHLDEAKAARLTGELVGYYGDVVDFTDLTKQRFEILVGHGKGQISYVQLCGHRLRALLYYSPEALGQRSSRSLRA